MLKLLIWGLDLDEAVPAAQESMGECMLRSTEGLSAQVLASMPNSRSSVRTLNTVSVLLAHQRPLHKNSQQGKERSQCPNTPLALKECQDQEEPMLTHQGHMPHKPLPRSQRRRTRFVATLKREKKVQVNFDKYRFR